MGSWGLYRTAGAVRQCQAVPLLARAAEHPGQPEALRESYRSPLHCHIAVCTQARGLRFAGYY